MRTTYTPRSKRSSQNSTRSIARGVGVRASPPSRYDESSSSDDDSRTTMGNDDDNNSSFSEFEDLPMIRSPDNEYFNSHIDAAGLRAEYESLMKRRGDKWNGIKSVSNLNHCYGQEESHQIMMENGNAVMEALRDLDSQHCEVFKDEYIDFAKMLKVEKHPLHHPATSSVEQALKLLVTEGKENLSLEEPSMDSIFKAAIPVFELEIKEFNFMLDPTRNYTLKKRLTSGGNDRIYKILMRMRHCLIKDSLEDDLKKKLSKSLKKEIHGLRQKIKKLELENLDMKRQLDKATQESHIPITESSHDFVTPLKSKDTNVKNENQRLSQRIAQLESLASNNVRMEQHGTFHFNIVETPSRGDIQKTEED